MPPCDRSWLAPDPHRFSGGSLQGCVVPPIPFPRTATPLPGTLHRRAGAQHEEACFWSRTRQGIAQPCLTTTMKAAWMPAISSTAANTWETIRDTPGAGLRQRERRAEQSRTLAPGVKAKTEISLTLRSPETFMSIRPRRIEKYLYFCRDIQSSPGYLSSALQIFFLGAR